MSGKLYRQQSRAGTPLDFVDFANKHHQMGSRVVDLACQACFLFAYNAVEYNFQLLMQSVMQDPAAYAGLRGFLLPRMEKYAKK